MSGLEGGRKGKLGRKAVPRSAGAHGGEPGTGLCQNVTTRGLWHSLGKQDGAGKGVTEKKPVLLSLSTATEW